MYTKFCYLFIAFMLLAATSISTTKSKSATPIAEKMTNALRAEQPSGEENAIPFPVEAPHKQPSHTAPKHHPDEDGKHHDFHFNRLSQIRWRQLCCFIAKVVLVVMHISWLIYGYMHLIH